MLKILGKGAGHTKTDRRAVFAAPSKVWLTACKKNVRDPKINFKVAIGFI